MFFLRKSTLEQLPVAMSGARMGERVLQIGIDDPSLAGAIAAKVGLSGHAAVAVTDDRTAERARAAGAKAGVLVDVQVSPLDTLPFAADAFDVIVIHASDPSLPSLESPAGVALLREGHRVLRSGGRTIIVEGGRRGIARLLRPGRRPLEPAATVTALATAGFRAARPLAAREGYRFAEGLK
jgi:SAM-dependent methyltransferase